MSTTPTERVEDAPTLQRLVAAGQWCWDVEKDALTCSAEFQRIFGLKADETLTTCAAFVDRVHSLDRERMLEAISCALESNRPIEVQLRIVRTDGDERTVRSLLEVVAHTDEAKWLQGVCWDITERTALEERLQRTHALASAGAVAAGLAHDLNNLVGALVLVADAPEPSSLGRQVRTLAERVTDIARRIVGLARPITEAPTPIDLDTAVREIMARVRLALSERFRLTVAVQSEAHVTILPVDLERVLWNLALNARDAQPTGGTIKVRTDLVETHDRTAYCRIVVTDYGCGMDESTRRRLFEPFFTDKGDRGTGLGLVVVQELVRNVGGAITIDSAPGKGTRVHVLLPIAVSPPSSPVAD